MMDKAIAFFQANPNYFGLIIFAFGLLFFLGALLRWKWVIHDNAKFRRSNRLLVRIFGIRGALMLSSAVIMGGGLMLFFLL